MKYRLVRVGLALTLLAGTAGTSGAHTFYHENVLGTSLQLHVESPSLETDRKAEAAILAEIERLSGILSTYRETSEFSEFLAGPPTPRAASPELVDVLRACDQWRAASAGAFNPAAEVLGRLWTRCARENRLPTDDELAEAVRRVQAQPWQIHADGKTITRLGDAPLSLNALAKGYIIDQAGRAALADRQVTGLLLDIGGDLRAWGKSEKVIGIADPWSPADNSPPLCCVEVCDGAVATSGNYERGFEIDGVHYSHIVDPRNGKPVGHIVSATVVAREAARADALATILNVLEPAEGVALVDRLGDAECLIVTRDGKTLKSAGWERLAVPEAELLSQAEAAAAEPAASPEPNETTAGPAAQFAAFAEPAQAPEQPAAAPEPAPQEPSKPEPVEPFAWGHDFELVVDFQLKSAGWYRYARPYVAVWVEDAKGKPVRTLALWGRDFQWLPYLYRWYSLHARNPRLIYAVSRPTRPPGRYRILWDGRASDGKHVLSGQYTVLIEASREHGTYQLGRQVVEIGKEPFSVEMKGNYEVPKASLEYRAKKPAEETKTEPKA